MELAALDATAQAELVRSGECSPSELLEACIEAVERLNPTLNSVVIPLYDLAREQVAADAIGRGPFRGVPLLLKDLGATLAGTPQYGGTRFLRDHSWVSPADSTLVERFRAAGFVMFGKTNTPELGLSPTTEPDTFGPTRNPWNPDRIVGGSSGGSAAAVASRVVGLAHAGDGGGSIRNPAGAVGAVGLKPSRGRTTLGPDVGEGWSDCITEHVITRTVRDTAAVLDCVAGYAPGDPAPAPQPARPFLHEVGADPGRLRVGLFWANGHMPGGPDARAAVEQCGALLERLGHDVHAGYPTALDRADAGGLLSVSVMASVAHELEGYSRAVGAPIRPGDVEDATWLFYEQGRKLTATEYLDNVDALYRYARELCGWWEDGNDVLVTPTMAEVPPPIGELKGAPVERIVRLVPYTSPFNVSGQPAIALPLYWNDEDLPLGVQLVGAYGREDLLLRVAAQLEQAAPWIDRRPPICA
jgi:amidase